MQDVGRVLSTMLGVHHPAVNSLDALASLDPENLGGRVAGGADAGQVHALTRTGVGGGGSDGDRRRGNCNSNGGIGRKSW